METQNAATNPATESQAPSILGAVLLTGCYGGVVATYLRIDNPLFIHMLFPVYLAILAWGGLWLVNERLRELIPLKD